MTDHAPSVVAPGLREAVEAVTHSMDEWLASSDRPSADDRAAIRTWQVGLEGALMDHALRAESVAVRRAEVLLLAMRELQFMRGRLSKVTVEDVRHVLDLLDDPAFAERLRAATPASGEPAAPREEQPQ